MNRTQNSVILSGAGTEQHQAPVIPSGAGSAQPQAPVILSGAGSAQPQTPVILSGAGSAQSAVPAQSKDPVFAGTLTRPRREFSARITSVAVLTLLLTTLAAAQTLTGTVKNSTTGKPAAGDEVVLLSLGQGMEEAGRTKADAKGNFSFKLDKEGPHLVRAIHEGVTYHRMAPPGTTSVEVEVYDVAKKLDGLEVVADIMRVQVEQGQLEVMRAFAVENKSKPPRTQMNERNLEFYVPEGAQIVEGSAMTAGGNPINSAPVPVDDKKTRYSFLFPLRPGTTQFQVAYQLPYSGSANIDPKSLYPLQHFVAIVPKGMKFAAAPGTTFQPMNDPQQPDADVQVASGAQPGQSLAFKVSGEGTLGARQENAGAPSAGGGGGGASSEDRPGGGLGPPIDAPNPLQKYQWWILGGFALALVVGGVFVARRQQAAVRAGRPIGKARPVEEFEEPEEEYVAVEAAPAPRPARAKEARAAAAPAGEPRVATPAATAPRSGSSMLLEGLKEELFQLEVEHKQGRISQQEYDTTKAALDQTLQRALKRGASNS